MAAGSGGDFDKLDNRRTYHRDLSPAIAIDLSATDHIVSLRPCQRKKREFCKLARGQ